MKKDKIVKILLCLCIICEVVCLRFINDYVQAPIIVRAETSDECDEEDEELNFNCNYEGGISSSLTSNLNKYTENTEIEFGDFKGVTSSLPSLGDQYVLFVMVDFNDTKFPDYYNQEYISEFMFGDEDVNSDLYPMESVKAFYERSSYGKFSLDGEIYEYHSSNNREYYENDGDIFEDVIDSYKDELMSKIDGTTEEKEQYVNDYLKKFDSNNDNIIDGIYIQFAGDYSIDVDNMFYLGKAYYYNGYTICDYTAGSICVMATQNKGNDVMVTAHETGHMLGLPDLYDSAMSTSVTYSFDIMDTNRGDHNGLSKMLLGWIDQDDVTIVTSGESNIALNPYAESGDIAIIVPDYDEATGLYTEFFMVEYFEATGNDYTGILEEEKGLRIFHVDATLNEYGNGFIADNEELLSGSNPLISMLDKDGYKQHTKLYSDAYYGAIMWPDWGAGEYECFYETGDELTPYTSPSTGLYGDARFDINSYSGIYVKDIQINDGKAVFAMGFEESNVKPDLTYSINSSNTNETTGILDVQLKFNNDVRLSNGLENLEAGYVLDSNGTEVAKLKLSLLEYTHTLCCVDIELRDDVTSLEADEYSVIIPVGTIATSYNTYNSEIVIPFKVSSAGDVVAEFGMDIPANYYDVRYDINENGDGGVVYLKREDLTEDTYQYDLYLSVIDNYTFTEKDILIDDNGIFQIETDYNSPTYSINMLDNGNYRIVLYYNSDYYVLIIDSDGKKVSCQKMNFVSWDTLSYNTSPIYLANDNKVTAYDAETFEIINEFQIDCIREGDSINNIGNIDDENTFIGTVHGDSFIVDSEGNIVVYNYYDGEGDGRHNGTVTYYDGRYYMLYGTYVFNGAELDYNTYVNVYDNEFRLIKKKLLSDNIYFAEKVYKINNGFVLTYGGTAYLCDNDFDIVCTIGESSYCSIDGNRITSFDLNAAYADGGPLRIKTLELYSSYVCPEVQLEKDYENSIHNISDVPNKEDVVKYSSSNSNVVQIDANGNIKALECGDVIITAIYTDNTSVEICNVNVVELKYVTIKDEEMSVTVGKDKHIEFIGDVSDSKFVYLSDNQAVATVNDDGVVTGISVGTARIIVVDILNDNNVSICEVAVVEGKDDDTDIDPTPEDPTPEDPTMDDPTPDYPEPEVPKYYPSINISYRTHIQSFGWEGNATDIKTWKSNGTMSGTSGKAKRLEGINIVVNSAEAGKDVDLGIQYTTHCQSYGWLPWSADGDMNGTEGEAKRLEAIKIQLTGADKDAYDVYYRVHAQSYGWLNWAKNGEPSGTAGYGKRLEGIQIVVVKKGENFDKNLGGIKSVKTDAYVAKSGSSPIVNYAPTSNTNPVIPGNDTPNVAYRTHVQSFGWQGWKYNGQMSGTSGLAKRLEGININLTNKPCDGDIVYTTHIQSYGWKDGKPEDTTRASWKKNGQMSGTSGEAKRLEAICIDLTGEMSEKYDIYYRVHAQSFGWLGWAKNGEESGTAGYAKRLEGIQIVLVPKGGAAPANNYGGVTSARTEAYIEK